MMNEFGLDVDYFRKNLKQLERDVDRYTPSEMHRALMRLASVADHQIGEKDPDFKKLISELKDTRY